MNAFGMQIDLVRDVPATFNSSTAVKKKGNKIIPRAIISYRLMLVDIISNRNFLFYTCLSKNAREIELLKIEREYYSG